MFRIVCISIVCFILTSAFLVKPSNTFPEKLSEWNIYEGKLANLQPSKGLIPYALNTPLFSDYAEKSRFIRLPQNTKVNFVKEGVFDFPEGTLIVKNFYYPRDFRSKEGDKQVVETRLLLNENNRWKAITYVWNDEQTEAFMEVAGDEKNIDFINEQGVKQAVRYIVPNVNQCKGCHNVNDNMMPIGPSASQLNGVYPYETGNENQLTHWNNLGILANMPELNTIAITPVWNNPSTGNLNDRARAYLAINCAHCHRSEGPAQTSGLILTETELDPTKIGIHKSPVAAGNGSGGRMVDILPGESKASILWYRMQTSEPGERMPELGRSSIHNEGVALIKEWIDQMKSK